MLSNKKIVIIGPAHPLRGGLATYNERLAKAFIQSGHDVTIFSFSLQYPGIFFPGKTQFADHPAPENLLIRTAINSVYPFNWVRVGREIKRMRPDIVIFRFWIPFMGPSLGTIARIVRSNHHSKILAIADNIIPHEKRPLDRQLTGYFIKAVDGFLFMSKSVMKDLDSFDKDKPRVFCPHPLYDNFGKIIDKMEAIRQLGLDSACRYVLFFGFIREYKGLDLMIKAFSDRRLADTGLKLIIAGEFYTNPEPYMDLIRNNNLENRIILVNDFIPNVDVGKYFCAADIVAQPYKEATQSGVTQIAYHFNRPMIITDVGGLAEMVPNRKVGFVVKPDEKSIADAIVEFYQEDLEEAFSRNVGGEKSKYSWDRMVNSLIDLSNTVSEK